MEQDETNESPALQKALHDLGNRESAWSLAKQLSGRITDPKKKAELEALADQRWKELEKERENYRKLLEKESGKTSRK